MKSQDEEPDFRFSYSHLAGLGDTSDTLYVRDKLKLNTYGIDDAYNTNIQTKTAELRAFPSDDELLGEEMDKCEIKDKLADDLKVFIRTFMVRVANVFPVNSGKWHKFGTKGLDEMPDLELGFCGDKVARMADKFLTDLTPKGIDAAMISDLTALTLAFNLSIKDASDAKSDRRSGTRERIELADSLYALINQMFDYGKDYWFTRNAARYKDYVIYDTSTGQPDVEEELGAVHGTALNSVTLAPAGPGSIYVEGFEQPIEIDADSAFSEMELVAGTYKCTVVIPGYDNQTITIIILPGEDITFDIMMDPTVIPPVPPPTP